MIKKSPIRSQAQRVYCLMQVNPRCLLLLPSAAKAIRPGVRLRERRAGQSVTAGHLRAPGHRTPSAHRSLGQRLADEGGNDACHHAAPGSGCLSQPTSCQQRQCVLRGFVQDTEVPASTARQTVQQPAAGAALGYRISSLVQPRTSPQRHSIYNPSAAALKTVLSR